MRLTSVYATTSFHLIMEFNNKEYRLLNVKQFLKDDKGLLEEVRADIDMFRTAMVDNVAGTVAWGNGVDFQPEHLYSESVNIDHILGNEGETRHEEL